MANVTPTFFSEHHTPRRQDARWKILQKILGALIDGGGGGGGVNHALQGVGPPPGPPPDVTETWTWFNQTTGSTVTWNTVSLAWE